MNHSAMKSFYNAARESFESVQKYKVLNMLLSYHFNYDKCDLDEDNDIEYPHLDFRCLSSKMLDENGELNYDEELLILMYYKGKFSGVLKYSRSLSYPCIEVYYTNDFKSTLFIGIVAQLYGESGLLIDDGIDDGVVGTLQSYIIDHQTKESNV